MHNEQQVGAAAGFLFAAGVLLQNGFLLQGMPLPGAPLDAVLAFYSGKAGHIAIACGWVAVNIPLLITFGAAVSRRMERAAPLAARVGFGGVVLLAAAFAATTWLQATLATRASSLATAGQLGLVWDLHGAAFSTSAIALSVALGAFSVGALREGTVPRWTAIVGLAGAASLVVSGTLIVGTGSGGIGIFFQLAGFAAWVVWLVTASVRLYRVPATS